MGGSPRGGSTMLCLAPNQSVACVPGTGVLRPGTRDPGPGSRVPGPRTRPPRAGTDYDQARFDVHGGEQRRKPLPRRLLRSAHPQRSAPRAARGWQTQAAASGMTNSTSLARLPTPAALARRTATDSCPLRRILLRRKALSRHLEASEPRCHGGRGRVSPR